MADDQVLTLVAMVKGPKKSFEKRQRLVWPVATKGAREMKMEKYPLDLSWG